MGRHGSWSRLHPTCGKQNYKAVERALGGGTPTLDGQLLDLPWVIVDGVWAASRPPTLGLFRGLGTRILVDTHAWRFREGVTWEYPSLVGLPYAPAKPLGESRKELEDYVRKDLLFQAEMGADAYIVPGFIPRSAKDQVNEMTLTALSTALAMTDLPPKPLVSFVGIHTKNLGAATDLLEQISFAVDVLYVQATPVKPMQDSVSKLVHLTEFLLDCQSDFSVIGGRLGAIGTMLRGLGIAAVDAGLGQGETFDRASIAKSPAKREGGSTSQAIGARLVDALTLKSMAGSDWTKLYAIENLRSRMICRLPCCTFRSLEDTVGRAREHSLHVRVSEALRISSIPRQARPAQAMDVLNAARHNLLMFNKALSTSGSQPFSTSYLEHQLGAIVRILGRSEAA